ncbi:RND family efflux transporter MFP subunit [Sphingomonas sp. BE270]|uniref:efflux RND transporter periplasmic adaptor subunit n=1 Tax=Sphingomonas sp. BE270 TaxID=2817726 RepID=UPI00285C0146|nr:efflux RND transporter periplasmic adaptor subunit [Sphingomonas sp. BE270]MDR7259930.1 RND family efflux transporter MFP subunit [Sphingomonas sp. BE270]
MRIATAKPADGSERAFTGIVAARVQSDLGFRVAGKVTSRLVEVGQTVRRGQILMRIDPVDLALQTAAQDRAVAAAQARAVQTAADERRYRDLVAGGAVSASAYDQAKAAALSAQAQLEAARAQARIAGNTVGYTVLRADADGVVVETLAEPGQVVAAGQTVLRLAHSGPREATISLPETVRPAIGSIASATLYDAPAAVRARLRQLSDAADPRTRTYEARYVLEGAAAAAPLGATVQIALSPSKAQPAISVPLAAVYDEGRGPGVWVLAGDGRHVAWRPVRVAALSEETASISAGLKPGERFVAMGAHLLHQNQDVRVAAERDNAL